jgi:hypothetical protein
MKTIQDVAKHTVEYASALDSHRASLAVWHRRLMACWIDSSPMQYEDFSPFLREKYGIQLVIENSILVDVKIQEPQKYLIFQIKYPVV